MKIYFVGAGPGDPDLLTIKAKRILEAADIIIYAGSLVSKDILKIAKKGAAVYDSSSMTLEDVLAVYSSARSSGKTIARLHSGDPSIYGAIQEQMDWLKREGMGYEVIPGISSFQAAAAALKQEFTLPNVSQTVILTRISGRTKVPPKENLQKMAKIGATMVIFLSVDKIEDVVNKLKAGYKKDTPCVVIERASCPDEKIINGTLANIVKFVRNAKIKRQALIMVGDVLRRQYSKSKLYDKNFTHGFRKKCHYV